MYIIVAMNKTVFLGGSGYPIINHSQRHGQAIAGAKLRGAQIGFELVRDPFSGREVWQIREQRRHMGPADGHSLGHARYLVDAQDVD